MPTGCFNCGSVKWTPKTGQPTKLLLVVQKRGKHGKQKEVAHGGVQGPGGLGRGQGRQDGQRVGQLARRASDDGACMEEATARQRGGAFSERRQGGERRGPRGLAGPALRADRPPQDRAGLAQKKSCPLRLRASAPGSIPPIRCSA